MRKEAGFTLIEVLTTILIASVLMTLAATALRSYWLGRALYDGAEEVVTGLRELQERSVSESHPLVFGAWFKEGSSTWGAVRYDSNDPSVSGDDECVTIGTYQLPAGVEVQTTTSFTSVSPQTSTCAAPAPSGSDIVFFFARGTSTGGDIELYQPKKDTTEDLSISPLTGRVERE
jgi:prepilin-type N-terminal cleavage/methylation domain-containing protein